jgi:hypothetical protein
MWFLSLPNSKNPAVNGNCQFMAVPAQFIFRFQALVCRCRSRGEGINPRLISLVTRSTFAKRYGLDHISRIAHYATCTQACWSCHSVDLVIPSNRILLQEEQCQPHSHFPWRRRRSPYRRYGCLGLRYSKPRVAPLFAAGNSRFSSSIDDLACRPAICSRPRRF